MDIARLKNRELQMIEAGQIYGDGVNIAARLQSLADPGGICISRTVHDQIGSKLPLAYEDLGEQTVKNIAKPVRVIRVVQTVKHRAQWMWCAGTVPSLGDQLYSLSEAEWMRTPLLSIYEPITDFIV
jgi:Adenylate and Guanylate cyclase catalytic domain